MGTRVRVFRSRLACQCLAPWDRRPDFLSVGKRRSRHRVRRGPGRSERSPLWPTADRDTRRSWRSKWFWSRHGGIKIQTGKPPEKLGWWPQRAVIELAQFKCALSLCADCGLRSPSPASSPGLPSPHTVLVGVVLLIRWVVCLHPVVDRWSRPAADQRVPGHRNVVVALAPRRGPPARLTAHGRRLIIKHALVFCSRRRDDHRCTPHHDRRARWSPVCCRRRHR